MLRPLIFVLLLMMLAAPAYSVTMEEAVEYALKNNPDLQALRLEEEAAKGQLVKAKLPLIANPTLEATTARKGKGPDSDRTFTDYGIQLSQEFEIAGQRGVRIAVAEKNLSRIDFEIRDRERTLAYEVRDAFARTLILRKKEELAKEAVRLREDLLGFTRIKFQAGDVSGLEVNLMEVELGKAGKDLVQAAKEYRESLLILQGIIGLKPDSSFTVTGDLSPDTAFTAQDKDRLKSLAVSQRPDIKAASSDEDRARTAVELVRREAVPNVTLSGLYNRDERRNIVGLSVSIPLPLFDRKQAERKEAKARAEQARIKRIGTEKTVEREIEEAYNALTSSLNELSLFKKEIISKSLENLELLNLAFREGKISFYDVRLAQRDTIDVRFAYLDTLLRAQLAYHAMQKTVGGTLK